jgi:hypothetical protein
MVCYASAVQQRFADQGQEIPPPERQTPEALGVHQKAGGAAVPGPTGEQLCHYLQLNGVPAKPLTVGLILMGA